MLFWTVFLLNFLLFASFADQSQNSRKLQQFNITVAFWEQKPFVNIDENGKPNGLDVQIIENFAKKYDFHINYISLNSSLNYNFANEESFKVFSHQDVFRFV